METNYNKFKIYLMAAGFMLFSVSVVAQTNGNSLKAEENPVLAIEKIEKNLEELKIFANSGELKISYEYPMMGNVKIQLFDVAGREIMNKSKEKKSSKFEFSHDVSSLPASVYIVRILQDNKKITRKLYI